MYNHLGIGRSSIGLNKCIMLLAEGGRGLWDLVVYYCNNFFFHLSGGIMVEFVHGVAVGAGIQVRVLGSRHTLYFLVLGHLNIVIITFHSISLFPFFIYLFI